MRLLPVGTDHVRFGAAREQPASDGCRHRFRDVRQHLPLRHVHPHSRRHQARRAIEWARREIMNRYHSFAPEGLDQPASPSGFSRRQFLKAGAAVGGGLLLSLRLPLGNSEADAAEASDFAPNAFIRIGRAGKIVLVMPYVEMGQGTYTSIPMLIAEELEV